MSSPMSGKASRQAAVLLASLRHLSCPLVQDVDGQRFSDLALLPCEWRQKLLLWFLTNMDSSLALSLTTNSKGSILTRLHDVFSSLGLCPAQRQDLVSGSARRLDQLAFYTKLVHVVEFLRHQDASGVTDNAVLEACVRLMNDGVSTGPLNRCFSSTASYLPPELGLQFRSEVEKRKTAATERDEEPLMWRLHAWRNDVLATKARLDEAMNRLPTAEFVSETEFQRRTDDLQRFAISVDRFLAADRRVFRAACEQRWALGEDAGTGQHGAALAEDSGARQLGTSLAQLRRRLEAVEAMTEGVRRTEEEVTGFETPPGTQQVDVKHHLAAEVCAMNEGLQG